MSAFNPGEIDWNLVLTLQEIKECLTVTDKIELSQSNKLFRLKLKPKLFSVIKYGLKSGDLKVFNEDLNRGELSLDYIRESFKVDLPQISQYVLELIIQKFFNIYNLLPISETFSNLNSISIFKISIPLNIMVESLRNLKKLQTLKLEQVTLVQFQSDSITGSLSKLPDTFSNLVLSDCYLIKSKLTADPLRLAYNYGRQALSKDYFHLMDQDFPNLSSFSIIGYKRSVSMMLPTFLTRHPLINKLKLTSNLLTQQTLDLISGLPNVTDLTIEDMGIDPTLNVPNFLYVKNFQMFFYQTQFNWKAIEFYKSMINLNSLTMNYYRNFAEVLSDILVHSPNLKTLKVFNNFQGELEFEYITKNQLRNIEILNFKQRSINLQILINSPKLTRLKIYKSSHKYQLTGIRYTKAANDTIPLAKILKFQNFTNYFMIYPVLNFEQSMTNFDRIYLNLHYFGDFNNCY